MILKKPKYEWYAVYTKVNAEKKILKNLEEQKIECYLPLIKSLRQWSDRKKWIEEPLFRSYVFVKVSHVEFFDVLAIPGVFSYVSFGGRAQPIPEFQIENVRKFVKQEEKEIILTREIIEQGLKAEVLSGPLKGVQGEVVQICGQYRMLIRIESMGCCIHANISKNEVKFLNTNILKNSIKQKQVQYN